MKAAILILTLLLTACTSTQKIFHPHANRNLVFPEGTYQHWIKIVRDGNYTETFDGVVKVTPHKITIVGLGALQSTMFRITDDRDANQVQATIFYEPLKQYEDNLKDFYNLLKHMLTAKLEKGKIPEEIHFKHQGRRVTIRFRDFDENQLPGKIEIDHPNFSVLVIVVGYEVQ